MRPSWPSRCDRAGRKRQARHHGVPADDLYRELVEALRIADLPAEVDAG